MTDKVQKIREEVVRMHKLLPSVIDSNNITLDYADRICTTLEMFIDSMQEECNITGIKSKHAEGKLKECIESITEESLAKARKQLEEESVSEELEEAANEIVNKAIPPLAIKYKDGTYVDGIRDYFDRKEFIDLVKAGAKWKEEQFEKERLKHCDALTEEQAQMESDFVTQHLKNNNRTPTFVDAIEYGMKLQKEKMMAEAIDVKVKVDASGYPYIPQMELYDYDKDEPLAKEGDRYKVVLIKEG